eukprot:TRINITY_DN1754_c0_g2_i1.p1 TRINITY_DN1754_c0_g2~~TRINITY_DN1754_c0_g2_i1.p1  ORF type:complete len:297 (+),score=52.85 TRINITY_DN1754_c0_g2_i1:99-989(+)
MKGWTSVAITLLFVGVCTCFSDSYQTVKIPKISPAGAAIVILADIHGVWNKTNITGSMWTITNPAYHWSIELPGGKCGAVAPVTTTSNRHNCVLSTNAGSVDKKGACDGNVISHGELIHTTSDLRANFGLHNNTDGSMSLIAGYITQASLTNLLINDMVSGYGWIIKNGTNNVAAAVAAEGLDNQLVNTKLARTVLAFDNAGSLVMYNIDGNPANTKGLSLHDLADYILSTHPEIVEAINLRGGTEATVVADGATISHCLVKCQNKHGEVPCKNNKWCQADVSAITCVFNGDGSGK